MLTRLTERLRVRAAIALAATYLFCVMFPPVAFAFGDGALAAHCLTSEHHGATHVRGKDNDHARTHVHGDGNVHKHADETGSANRSDSKPAKYVGSCCGLFCFAAVTAESHAVGRQPVHASAAVPVWAENLVGQRPGRIDRPPSTTFMSF